MNILTHLGAEETILLNPDVAPHQDNICHDVINPLATTSQQLLSHQTMPRPIHNTMGSPQNMTSSMPSSLNMTPSMPSSQNMTSSMPSSQNMTSSMPSSQNMTSSMPSSQNMTSAMPPSQNMTSSMPPSQNMTSSMPSSNSSCERRVVEHANNYSNCNPGPDDERVVQAILISHDGPQSFPHFKEDQQQQLGL